MLLELRCYKRQKLMNSSVLNCRLTKVLVLIIVINLVGYGLNELYLFNEYSLFEYLLFSIVHGLVLVFLYKVFKRKIYMVLILFMLTKILIPIYNDLFGYDLIFYINFSFSRLIFYIYETVLKDFSKNSVLLLILLNLLFFLYELLLLKIIVPTSGSYWSNATRSNKAASRDNKGVN
jgi:hypothetical protein